MTTCALALQNIQPESLTSLILREVGVALINGLMWSGIIGGITWWSYDGMAFSGVMTLAIMLSLLMATLMRIVIPMTMVKFGHDPVVGSSVTITAIIDTGSFFIFPGLVTLFLVQLSVCV